MSKTELAVACILTDSEMRIRRENVLSKVAERLLGCKELANGYSYCFPAEDQVLQDLINLINLERKCCSFLNFKLIVESQNESVALELTGQQGTKEFLKTIFNWNN